MGDENQLRQPNEEEQALVETYLGRDDRRGKLITAAVANYHEMSVTLEKRSARRIAQGKSLVKYDPLSGQGRILAQLCEEDAVNQAALANKLNVKPQTLSTAIKKLEAKGLVERKQNPEDGRAYLVFITAQGRSLKEKLVESEPYSGSMFECLSNEELEQAISIAKKLAQHLEQEIRVNDEVEELSE